MTNTFSVKFMDISFNLKIYWYTEIYHKLTSIEKIVHPQI